MGFLDRLFGRRDREPRKVEALQGAGPVDDRDDDQIAAPTAAREAEWVSNTPIPDLPAPQVGEVRLSRLTDIDAGLSTVTVTCEEHYQDAVVASMPPDWNRDWWPALATWVIATSNPHEKVPAPCIEIRFGDATVGYLTVKMTARYFVQVQEVIASGGTVTSPAQVSRGTKGGHEFWRVKLVTQAMA